MNNLDSQYAINHEEERIISCYCHSKLKNLMNKQNDQSNIPKKQFIFPTILQSLNKRQIAKSFELSAILPHSKKNQSQRQYSQVGNKNQQQSKLVVVNQQQRSSKLWNNKAILIQSIKYSMQNQLIDVNKFNNKQIISIKQIIINNKTYNQLNNNDKYLIDNNELIQKRSELFQKQITNIIKFNKCKLVRNYNNAMINQINNSFQPINNANEWKNQQNTIIRELVQKQQILNMNKQQMKNTIEILINRYRQLLKQDIELSEEIINLQIEQQNNKYKYKCNSNNINQQLLNSTYNNHQQRMLQLQQQIRQIKNNTQQIVIQKQKSQQFIQQLNKGLNQINKSQINQNNKAEKNILIKIKDNNKRLQSISSRINNRISYYNGIKCDIDGLVRKYLKKIEIMIKSNYDNQSSIKELLHSMHNNEKDIKLKNEFLKGKQQFQKFYEEWKNNRSLIRKRNKQFKKVNKYKLESTF